MGKKSSIFKKLNPILKEADSLKKNKNYKEAVRKYREGINFLRLKATAMEDREVEVSKIMVKIDQTHSAEIDYVIGEVHKLTDKKEFERAFKKLNEAKDIASNIEDSNFKNSEIEKIRIEKSKTELKNLIEQGLNLIKEEQLDDALETLKKALNDANKIYGAETEDKEIINIKNLINQTYSNKIKHEIEIGIDYNKSGKLEEAIKKYEDALKISEAMFDSAVKETESSNLKNQINQTYVDIIKPILESVRKLIDDNKKENAITELKKAESFAIKMFDSSQKSEELRDIGELLNPLYVEKIKPIKEKGLEVTKKEKYQESTTTVIEAATIFHQALDHVNQMIDSEQKNKELENLSYLINKTCSAGIQVRENNGLQLIDDKKYEDAISEMYSALSIAKNMACEDDQNDEIEIIKKYINKVYSAQIEDVLEKGKEILTKKKFEEAREIFNEAMSISNKMYVSDEMEREIGKIKNLLYQAEMKQVVAAGYISEELKKFEKELDNLNKELEKANLITDPEGRRKKISDVKHQIDKVYSSQIKLLIEQGNLQADEDKFDAAIKEIDKALKFIDLIGYPVVKDNELVKIINATLEFGNKLAKKRQFDEAFADYDKALEIADIIRDKDLKKEQIANIKLTYENELNNKVKQDLENGNFDIAIDYCKKAIKLDQNYVESYQNMGNAFINKKEYDNAIKFLKNAVELDPNHVSSWNDMCLAYELKGDFDNALNSISIALEIDPNYAIAWYRKGNVYKKKGELNQGIESYKKAIDLKPDYAKAWLFMGSIYTEIKEYHKAIECIEKAIELDSQINKEISHLIDDFKKILNSIQEKLTDLFRKK
ncbi:MAG: tetratricopeptide repeat protein [Promethearchaeota archaeon]